MEDTSFIGKIICAAILGFAFSGIAVSTIGSLIPETAAIMNQISTLKTVSAIGFGTLGAWMGWKCSSFIIQTSIYLWIANALTSVIYAIWS